MNFRNLEDNGFIKFDFLGLTLLKDVENCIRRILTRENGKEPTFLEIRDWFDAKLNCRHVKQDDDKVWQHVYHQRRKTGVFQFTAEGARRFCEDAKPTTIIELAALTAIYRPGPLRANVHKKYVKDKMKLSTHIRSSRKSLGLHSVTLHSKNSSCFSHKNSAALRLQSLTSCVKLL